MAIHIHMYYGYWVLNDGIHPTPVQASGDFRVIRFLSWYCSVIFCASRFPATGLSGLCDCQRSSTAPNVEVVGGCFGGGVAGVAVSA